MTKYYYHFLILNTFVIVPVTSQWSYTALPSYWVERGSLCHLTAKRKNFGGCARAHVCAESHILPGNSITAVILLHCNKKMKSPTSAVELFLGGSC
jgi:hypothetical protein